MQRADIPRRNSSDPTSSSTKTGDTSSMQNLRGVFLSKEEREKQGLGKKGDVTFSLSPFSLTTPPISLNGVANHVGIQKASAGAMRSASMPGTLLQILFFGCLALLLSTFEARGKERVGKKKANEKDDDQARSRVR